MILEKKTRSAVFFFAGVLLLTVCSLRLPQAGTPLAEDVDSSLGAVLHFAREHRLQFGTDLVFTYGPFGFLTFFYYYPHSFAAQLIAHFLLGFAAAVGVCLIAKRLHLIWRWLLVLTFVWVCANGSPRVDLVLDIGLFCWCLLCFLESGKRLIVCATVFAALAVFAALTKISFLFLGLAGVLLLGVDFAIRGSKALALAIVGGSIVLFLLGWIGAGQDFVHISSFLANSLVAANGYNETMGMEGANLVRERGLIWAVLSLALMVCWSWDAFDGQAKSERWRRLLVGCWCFLFLLMIWKYAFVRVDRFHLLVSLAFASLAPLVLLVVPISKGWLRWFIWPLTVVCWLVPAIVLKALFVPGWRASMIQPFRSFRDHSLALVEPSQFGSRLEELLEANRKVAQLPDSREIIGRQSVDVFGQDCGYAVFNDFNYQPRPVFQSYFAANKRLQILNENFYTSSRAPQFVLFGYGPLDLKFPPLPDARSLVYLLSNYEAVTNESQFLLLRAKSSLPIKRTLLAQGTVRPGQRIDMQPFGGTNLWLEMDLGPTMTGRLRRWIYRSPQVRLAAWDNVSGKLLVRNRSPAPMLAAGFLASPLLLNAQDVRHLYEGQPVMHPGAYSVEIAPDERYLWQDRIEWRAYDIENQLGKQ